jgi:scyllo-inositol 2-dehydrogenase (NADP+)
VDDAFELLMMKGPRLIKLGVSSLASAPAPRFRVHGTHATFLKTGLDVQEQQLRDGSDPLGIDFGCEPQAQYGRLISAAHGAAPAGGAATARSATEAVVAERGRWLEFYRLMRVAIESGGAVPVSLDEARETVEILDAARRSNAEGRRIELGEPVADG